MGTLVFGLYERFLDSSNAIVQQFQNIRQSLVRQNTIHYQQEEQIENAEHCHLTRGLLLKILGSAVSEVVIQKWRQPTVNEKKT